MKFKQLSIGQGFDFVNDAEPGRNSFGLRCFKTSTRKYRDVKGVTHQVGTVNVTVYHVGANPVSIYSNRSAT